MKSIKLRVEGMSCNHCKNAVTQAIEELPGIEKVVVDLAEKTVSIDFDPSVINHDAFVNAIAEAGYEVV